MTRQERTLDAAMFAILAISCAYLVFLATS
jgi:hypothetical protein